jgi:DNA invertase Pin-like site-specific DNA recombinase
LDTPHRDIQTESRPGSSAPRPERYCEQLKATPDFIRDGHMLAVATWDHLACSVSYLGSLIEAIATKGLALRITTLGIDTLTPTGKMMLNVLGGIPQFRKKMTLKHQHEGIAQVLEHREGSPNRGLTGKDEALERPH